MCLKMIQLYLFIQSTSFYTCWGGWQSSKVGVIVGQLAKLQGGSEPARVRTLASAWPPKKAGDVCPNFKAAKGIVRNWVATTIRGAGIGRSSVRQPAGHDSEDPLHLAPTLPLAMSSDNKEEDEATKILDQEQMARVVEITTTTGASRRWQDSVHRVEPGSWSRFWVTGADDEESEEEAVEYDIPSTSVLIQEAMQVGFSIDQLWKAEEDHASPASSAKVKNPSNSSPSS
jgi:hypothetical protein